MSGSLQGMNPLPKKTMAKTSSLLCPHPMKAKEEPKSMLLMSRMSTISTTSKMLPSRMSTTSMMLQQSTLSEMWPTIHVSWCQRCKQVTIVSWRQRCKQVTMRRGRSRCGLIM